MGLAKRFGGGTMGMKIEMQWIQVSESQCA